MRRWSACFCVAALSASPAIAQINTTCSQLGQFTNCQTNDNRPRPPINYLGAIPLANPVQAFQQGAAIEEARQAALARRQAELDQQAAEPNRTYVDRQVGSLIVMHDCENAKSMALKNGRFDLADRVAQFCTPTPKAP